MRVKFNIVDAWNDQKKHLYIWRSTDMRWHVSLWMTVFMFGIYWSEDHLAFWVGPFEICRLHDNKHAEYLQKARR